MRKRGSPYPAVGLIDLLEGRTMDIGKGEREGLQTDLSSLLTAEKGAIYCQHQPRSRAPRTVEISRVSITVPSNALANAPASTGD